ncbi:hypothetical protein [Paracoccus spongiarum]|uniref:Uncharacterized protein n=1 Tax=Paracoccus spongiarum TaxID=3064387 RepID=A0ABT9J7N9_9RHOB|nr:hypothetical protein [Paracoccus sp. 2205BS29-5]MDP5305823.1 hypothetical protein [Paracoccus sp. 2205BS29-5]
MKMEPAPRPGPTFARVRAARDGLRRTRDRMLDGGIGSMPAGRVPQNGTGFPEQLMPTAHNVVPRSALEPVGRMRRP